MNLNGTHIIMIFPNSEPPGRGLDIKQGPESVPLFGGLLDHPLVGLNETKWFP